MESELPLFDFLPVELLICWISKVIFSVFMAPRTLPVTVGKRARTVKVQSS